MKQHEFAILHESPRVGQILINTDYNHDDGEFKMSVKWWQESVNGFVTLGLNWADEKEADYLRTFENFRSLGFAEDWIKKIVEGISSKAKK